MLAHFKFNDFERDQFMFLALKAKAASDPALQTLLQNGWGERPEGAPASGSTAPNELVGADGSLLTLSGEADPARVNEILRFEGLRPLLLADRASILLSVCAYSATNAGPYNEFYCGILAQPTDAEPTDLGLSFRCFVSDSEKLVHIGRTVWGNEYRRGQVALEKRDEKIFAAVSANGRSGFRAEAASAAAAWTEAYGDVRFFGFSKRYGARTRHAIQVNSTARERPFLKGDAYEIEANSDLESLLKRCEFKPIGWTYRTSLRFRSELPGFRPA